MNPCMWLLYMYPEFAKQSVDSEALQQLHKMDKWVKLLYLYLLKTLILPD